MSKHTPILTITTVVPTYNSRHIEACLKSILAQTETSLTEIIVVDDASTDDTVDRILDVKSTDPTERIKLLRLENNRGPSAAKNAGILAAESDHIATIDSDMVLEKNCLQNLREALMESEASAAMAYFLVPRNMRVLTRVIGYDLEFRISRILRGKPLVEVGKVGTGSTLIVKKDLLEVGLFDETRRVGEDTALSYRLREMGRKLVIVNSAKCWHYWQSRGLWAYVRQQVGYGEGILQAYMDGWRMPRDPVSSPLMRLNALLAAGSIIVFLLALSLSWLFWLGLAMILAQIVIDLPAMAWILARKCDVAAGLLAPVVFLVRNYSWAASLASITVRLLTRKLKGSKSSSIGTPDTPD